MYENVMQNYQHTYEGSEITILNLFVKITPIGQPFKIQEIIAKKVKMSNLGNEWLKSPCNYKNKRKG